MDSYDLSAPNFLTSVIEAYSNKDNSTTTFDRRLSLLAQGTSSYTGNLATVQVHFPPGHRIFPVGSEYEAVFTITGLVIDKCLPPFEMTSEKKLNRPSNLFQTITIIGAGSPTFDLAIRGMDVVYGACEREFPEGKLVANSYTTEDGLSLLTASNRWFTSSHEAGDLEHIPFTTSEDPRKLLQKIAKGKKYKRTIDNTVAYNKMTGLNSAGQSILHTMEPHSIRNHDIVEIGITFTILQTSTVYRLLPILRFVTVLEAAQQKLNIPRAPISGRCLTSRECGYNKSDYSRYKAPEVLTVTRPSSASSFPTSSGESSTEWGYNPSEPFTHSKITPSHSIAIVDMGYRSPSQPLPSSPTNSWRSYSPTNTSYSCPTPSTDPTAADWGMSVQRPLTAYSDIGGWEQIPVPYLSHGGETPDEEGTRPTQTPGPLTSPMASLSIEEARYQAHYNTIM